MSAITPVNVSVGVIRPVRSSVNAFVFVIGVKTRILTGLGAGIGGINTASGTSGNCKIGMLVGMGYEGISRFSSSGMGIPGVPVVVGSNVGVL